MTETNPYQAPRSMATEDSQTARTNGWGVLAVLVLALGTLVAFTAVGDTSGLALWLFLIGPSILSLLALFIH